MFQKRSAAMVLASLAIPMQLRAAPTVVTIDDQQVFPESVTSTTRGDLIIGSNGKGTVYRSKAGSDKATLWLDPAKTGMVALLGVYADNASGTLYVCSVAPPGTPKQTQYAALRTFDLKSGAPKNSYPMIAPEKAACNDIDVSRDGTAYITDTGNGQVLRLKKGAPALEVWVQSEQLTGIDGIALGKGVMYVNSVRTSKLFSIAMGRDGAAGLITELKPSLKLARPDGMRALGGNKFLMAENAPDVGRITEVTVHGSEASMRVLKVDPGVTAITKIGNLVWVDNAKFAYRGDGAMKGQSPEPFTIYAIPLK